MTSNLRLHQFASFLTAPVDLALKKDNTLINKCSTTQKVALVALSLFAFVVTLSLSFLLGKKLLNKVTIPAPQVQSAPRPVIPLAAPRLTEFSQDELAKINQDAREVIRDVLLLCDGYTERLKILGTFSKAVALHKDNTCKAKWNQAVQPMIGWFGRKFEGKPNPFAVLKTSHSLGRSA